MKIRVISLLLVLCMIGSVLISCSDAGTPEGESTPANQPANPTAGTSDEPSEDELSALEQRQRIPDDLPDVTFDGRSYTIETETRKVYEILSEELNGESCNDAVYNRNLTIEKRFDVKIGVIENETPYNEIVTSVTAGMHDYDVAGFINYLTLTPVSARVLYNWLDIPRVDLDKPWHNKLANDDAMINDRLYAINSDLSISTLLYTYGMFFNYNIMEQYGYTSSALYDIVFEGKWTIDRLTEISAGIWEDKNGNGKHDEDDIHGYGVINGQINTHDVWLAALDISPLLVIRAQDDYDVNIFTDRTVTALEKVNYLYHNSEGTFFGGSDWRGIPKMFAEGKLAMSQLYFGETTESLGDMQDTYGILPLPKLDEEQPGYYTNCWDQFTVFAVPKTMPEADAEFVGIIYEVLCAETYKTVFPAYYDVALKSRYSAEPATAQMIDLIMAGRKLDFTFQYGSKLQNLPYQFRVMVVNDDSNIASWYKKSQKSLNKNIEKFLKLFYEED
ncbi:MAG: hypothetical protein IKQ92_13930 [Clostridia bacterium]|nr:hypothetical protein [Clostridia bacterium]